jgi:hypothetical protein
MKKFYHYAFEYESQPKKGQEIYLNYSNMKSLKKDLLADGEYSKKAIIYEITVKKVKKIKLIKEVKFK